MELSQRGIKPLGLYPLVLVLQHKTSLTQKASPKLHQRWLWKHSVSLLQPRVNQEVPAMSAAKYGIFFRNQE